MKTIFLQLKLYVEYRAILDIDNLTQVYYEFFSKPAVAKAFDAFKDQQAFIENNAMPMPPELKSQVDSMVTLQWATLCQHFNEQKKKLEKEFEERLKEARSARDDALDNNELLKRTNQELSSRLQEASEKNNELHAANENFKEELNKKNFEIGMLQERVKAQETSIKDLKGAFDKIANK